MKRIGRLPLRNSLTLTGIFISVFLLVSCSTEKKSQVAGLLDIDSILHSHIRNLINERATINKRAILNGVEQLTTVMPKDSAEWSEELAIFFELSAINKPSSKGTYKVDESADNKSNLTVKSFVTTEDLPVRYLKVYYHKSINELRKIEAQYREANALYSSTRFLIMEFESVYGKTLLTSYSITGGQKMFLDDSVEYNIAARVSLKK